MDRKEEEDWREKDNRQNIEVKEVLSMTQFKFLGIFCPFEISLKIGI